MARRSDLVLDEAAIVDAAFALVEAEGLRGLNMRALAERLSVQAPALYWHVANKDALLTLMARRIYAEARGRIGPAGGWREWLLAFGRALREAYGSHREGAQICAIAQPIGTSRETAEWIAAPLVVLGISEADAITFQASIISLALGWALFQANGPMHSFLSDMMEFDRAFETGLNALVAGYAPTSATT